MFYPGSAISQRELDSRMRCALADSLTHVAAVSADNLKVAEADSTGALSEIRAHRISPGVFGRYYDLVFAFAAERHDDAQRLWREIVRLARKQPQFSILPYDEGALGPDTERARLLWFRGGIDGSLDGAGRSSGFDSKRAPRLHLR